MPIFRRPVRRTRRGTYQIGFGTAERDLLRSMVPQMRDLLADPDQPGMRRLFPPAYHEQVDGERQEEYRRLMQEDLVARHGDALDILERTADAEEVTADELEAWARALNQVRLVLGTRLDVTEADEPGAAADPEHQLYYLLGYLQECVIAALSGEG